MKPLTNLWVAGFIFVVTGSVATHTASGALTGGNTALPIRGIHLSAPSKRDVPLAVRFIRDTLAKERVNTLILEFDYGFDFQSRPEFSNPAAPDREDVRQILKASRAAGIELIPQINGLGHQSWSGHTNKLLEVHPEFDETPGKYPGNKGIYCRSYCPLHPQVHKVLFALFDELAAACEAKSFHVGMDEVFILADEDCPRCRGRSHSDAFAAEVKVLHDHLKEIGCRMWMWGDRFIDANTTKIGEWEASRNGTAPAIDLVPKDIVICDWHYDKAHDTPRLFAEKGFSVVACPWRKSDVALAQLGLMRDLRRNSDPAMAGRALGMLHTTWCGFAPFVRACEAASTNVAPSKAAATETARCFTTLFREMRE